MPFRKPNTRHTVPTTVLTLWSSQAAQVLSINATLCRVSKNWHFFWVTVLRKRLSWSATWLMRIPPRSWSNMHLQPQMLKKMKTNWKAGRRNVVPTLRWLARVDSISTLLSNFEEVYDAVSEIKDVSAPQSPADASSFLHSISQFNYIYSAVILSTCLRTPNHCSSSG